MNAQQLPTDASCRLTRATIDSMQWIRHTGRHLLELQKDREQVRVPACQQQCLDRIRPRLGHPRWCCPWHASVRRFRSAPPSRPRRWAWRTTNAASWNARRTGVSAAAGTTRGFPGTLAPDVLLPSSSRGCQWSPTTARRRPRFAPTTPKRLR